MFLVAISQGGQVQARELAAGHDQRIGFSSIEKEKERKKPELSDAGFWFCPVNPGEFTPRGSVRPTMASGPRGQIKSFQRRTFSISVSPGSCCWQKYCPYEQSRAAHGEAAPTLAVNPPGRQTHQGQAILSQAVASAVAMMGLHPCSWRQDTATG